MLRVIAVCTDRRTGAVQTRLRTI